MSVSVNVDFTQMDGVFNRYLAATHYEVKKGILYQLRNWMVKASQRASWGDARFIQSPDPKLIAWLMSTGRRGEPGGGTKYPYAKNTIGRRMVYPRMRKDGTRKAPYMKMLTGKEQSRQRAKMQFYSRAEAAKFAVKHFAMRARASHFIGAFLCKMTRAIKGAIGSPAIADNRRLGNAINANLLEYGHKGFTGVSVNAMYGYKHATTAAKKVTTEESARQLERWILKAIEDAKVDIIPNMEQKIAQKLQQAADKAKGRAA